VIGESGQVNLAHHARQTFLLSWTVNGGPNEKPAAGRNGSGPDFESGAGGGASFPWRPKSRAQYSGRPCFQRHDTYLLPLKNALRRKVDITAGHRVAASMEIEARNGDES
jgi:hypothetical protein